jgi:hypothetical protein
VRTTARDLLDLIADFVAARTDGDDDRLQEVAQRFDLALGEAIVHRSSVQNEA